MSLLLSVFSGQRGGQAVGQTITYDDRVLFEAQLPDFIVDDYSNSAYFVGDVFDGATLDTHSDSQMSGIIGETD